MCTVYIFSLKSDGYQKVIYFCQMAKVMDFVQEKMLFPFFGVPCNLENEKKIFKIFFKFDSLIE